MNLNFNHRTNARIQRAVDQRPGHKITRFAAMHKFACGTEAPYKSDDTEASARIEAEGRRQGLYLANKAYREFERRRAANSLGDDHPLKGFGIYVTEQQTSDGPDYLYFIGTPQEILDNLRSVEATE